MTSDPLITAKRHILKWIEELVVGGSALAPATKAELLMQLALASPEPSNDGAIEFVLPGLSSLGLGIFRRSFRQGSMLVRVVPYGNC
jgi:hypothetical protein